MMNESTDVVPEWLADLTQRAKDHYSEIEVTLTEDEKKERRYMAQALYVMCPSPEALAANYSLTANPTEETVQDPEAMGTALCLIDTLRSAGLKIVSN